MIQSKLNIEYKYNWISTTIKKKYMELILSGKKTTEYKENTEYWNKRLNKIKNKKNIAINFLCGRINYKFEVILIEAFFDYSNDGCFIDIDGKKVYEWWEIRLGKRIKWMDNNMLKLLGDNYGSLHKIIW